CIDVLHHQHVLYAMKYLTYVRHSAYVSLRRRRRTSQLFPYPTLFRSNDRKEEHKARKGNTCGKQSTLVFLNTAISNTKSTAFFKTVPFCNNSLFVLKLPLLFLQQALQKHKIFSDVLF